MAQIINVLKESMPAVRLIGKKYTNADSVSGGFGHKWGEWFSNGYFNALKQCEMVKGVSDDYVGAMRITPDGFEYWIGLFMSPASEAPEGFEYQDIPEGDIGVCYLYGNPDSGELYSMQAQKACWEKFKEKGWSLSRSAWCFERYNCPRYTQPDDKGKVILDVCVYLDKRR